MHGKSYCTIAAARCPLRILPDYSRWADLDDNDDELDHDGEGGAVPSVSAQCEPTGSTRVLRYSIVAI